LIKVKTSPLIFLGLFFSSISMLIYAYKNYANQEIGYGIIFTLLFIFLIGLVFLGIRRNKKIDQKKRIE
jgi:ABC-type transport system involved in multi-copper enzyme maturation permease subunit